jgi:lipopolysaccharide transport system permease protein
VELTLREIRERYAASVLGSGWAVIAPLLTMGVYVLLFGVVFPTRVPGSDTAWSGAALVLAALPPWLALADVLTRAPSAFTSNRSLVRQVVFPTEVLVARIATVTLVPWAIGSVISIGLAAWTHGFTAMMLLLPALWIVQFAGMLGIALLLAPAGAWIRDLKDMMAFLATIGLFLTPILFTPQTLERLPDPIRAAMTLNPCSHMAWVYRDALATGAFEHPASWIVFPVVSFVLLLSGALFFLHTRHAAAEVL